MLSLDERGRVRVKLRAMIHIREYRESDWPSIWPILNAIIRRGDSYAFSPDTTEAETHRIWIESTSAVFVASIDDQIVGTYYIKPNQPCLGDHVANGGYAVAEQARSKGIASAMCEDSQQRAIAIGFRAMQYNFVVSSNDSAVRLWKKHGFDVIGIIPEAFRHPTRSFVDAFIMYKKLTTEL
jgi:L-amino acid N-acyltransferase YncA